MSKIDKNVCFRLSFCPLMVQAKAKAYRTETVTILVSTIFDTMAAI